MLGLLENMRGETMIKIENTEVYGWEAAIRGLRNPMNSWDKSDSEWLEGFGYVVGNNDLSLMKKLCKAGTDHRKFMRMINVTCDITAPLYWWKQFDQYKVGTVSNSTSTMHKIHSKEFTRDDFSNEHLSCIDIGGGVESPYKMLQQIIKMLNECRTLYLQTKDKEYWYSMIQLLPSSYNQKRTIQLNYEVLSNMYKSRKNHKLNCWVNFCEWIKSLPYSELIIGE